MIDFLLALVLCMCTHALSSAALLRGHPDSHNVTHRRLFQWGNTFFGLAPTYNVKYDCSFNGQPMCCSIVNDESHELALGDEIPAQMAKCIINKVYVPSPYEIHNFELAKYLSKVPIWINRVNGFINSVRGEVDASNIWLERVRVHMQSAEVPVGNADDLEYLSRFEVTKTCTGALTHMNSSWIEWIEPLTIHARHPFALNACRNVYTDVEKQKMKFSAQLQSLDYVLVQSGLSLHEQTTLKRHNHTRFEAHRNHHAAHREAHVNTHNFFLDAGTSTFESSLRWFLCAYMQRKVAFDQDYGFEYTLLEPQDFWKRVPPKIRSVYHFFNAPVSAHQNATDLSPIQIILNIARPEDFVSFKLDIDTPAVEIPIALELLHRPEVAALVDEFFFELHFRCEVMMSCGWGDKMPAEYEGLKLDRLSAMNFFRQLRELGIRAHIWP